MPRVHHCAGCVQLEREAGDHSKPSDEALQGTEIAEALERMDTEGLDSDGQTIAERLLHMEQRAVDDWLKDIGYKKKPTMVREERLWIRQEGQKVASAKPDVFYLAESSALVLNHKTGYLPIPAAAINIQIRTEALALWHEYPRLQTIRACTAHYRFTEKFDACDYGVADLQRAQNELFFHLWRATLPNAPRVPSEHCKYCKALAICPQAASFGMLPMVHTGADLMKKKDVIAKVYTLELPQLAFIRERKAMIENFLEAVDERMKGFTPEELASVGWGLQSTGHLRSVPNIQALWAEIHKTGLLTDEEFRACLKAVIGKVEEALVAKIVAKDGGSQKDALAKAKAITQPAVTFTPKSPTLKPLKGDKCLPETSE